MNMKSVIYATLAVFCAILVAVWVLSERAHPVMLNIDPAHSQHH